MNILEKYFVSFFLLKIDLDICLSFFSVESEERIHYACFSRIQGCQIFKHKKRKTRRKKRKKAENDTLKTEKNPENDIVLPIVMADKSSLFCFYAKYFPYRSLSNDFADFCIVMVILDYRI